MPAPAQDNSIMSTHGASRLARQTTAKPRGRRPPGHPCSLALRILVVATIGYILATQFVSRSFSYLLEPITAVYETLRGQMHALRTELDPQPPAEREAYLRDHIKPHYGLGLQIKTPAQA